MAKLLAIYHAHPIVWTLAAIAIGYCAGMAHVLRRLIREERRMRKRLGIATFEDFLHDD